MQDTLQEVRRLQRCMNDLVSVLALPAVWSSSEPQRIPETILDALLKMLDLDFCYARVTMGPRQPQLEVLKLAQSFERGERAELIREMVREWSGDDARRWPGAARRQLEDEEMWVFPLPLGIEGEAGILVVGVCRAGFPADTERLILSVAANQAAIGLQQARMLSEQRRIARELDERVAQRTEELAAANQVLREEIAERKQIEERLLASEALLKKSEAKLRQVIDAIPTLSWCNLPDGPNEFLSKSWHEYTGLSPEESHGWGWQAAFHVEDLPALLERWQQMLRSGEPGEIEARLRRWDGVYRWFLVRAAPFRDESSGAIVRWYGTSTDIDDRKRAEEELLRKEVFLEKAQRLSATGSFSWCVDTEEIRFSEEACRIFGFEPSAPVDFAMIESRVHPEDIPLLAEWTAVARSLSEGRNHEIRLRMPDGGIKYLHTTSSEMRDVTGRQEYIGAIQDVTQQRHAQEALNKARSELAHVSRITSLSAFTASMAHEINQPLSGIITNASTCLRMLDGQPPNIDGARETARRTIRDGNRVSDVIARLRALFSRKQVRAEAVDLNEVAREVLALSMAELARSRVALRQQFAAGLPRILGDRIQLQQVIVNLLRNAADAMSSVHDRPRELLVSTELAGEEVQLKVRDAGVGIDPAAMDRIFESFYTTKHDGMGIGLSVSRSIVEAHNGRLWGMANDGPGATFGLAIPRRRAAHRGSRKERCEIPSGGQR